MIIVAFLVGALVASVLVGCAFGAIASASRPLDPSFYGDDE